jgi:steroid delta-isomerase-like uncharacterized protein
MKSALALLLLISAPAWAAAVLPPVVSVQEQNKAVALRVFNEIFNQGKFQVANEIYAKDFVNHGLHRDANLAQDQAWAHWEKQALPDIKITAGPMVAEGDLVSVLWIARGTNTASFGWLPATGTKVEVRGITIWRIVNGKIREEWSTFDQMRVVRELAEQLRWQLLGLACVAGIMFWIALRLMRKLFLRLVPARS